MGYQRGQTAQPLATVLTVEQARNRNAALRRELAALTLENRTLAQHVEAARRQVSEARRVLTRKIRDLDVIREQIEGLRAVPLPGEPVYGGREGLEAAAKELEEHDLKGGLTGRPRRKRGRSHGTRDKYGEGCRCVDCLAWRKRKSERGRVTDAARRARKRAA